MKRNIPYWISSPSFFRFCLVFGSLLFFVKVPLWGESARGYLVTKSGVQLTGVISEVFDNDKILFINDFGTPYKVHAALIRGFVVPRQGTPVFFASKFNGERWHFMQLLHQGEGMNLYVAPSVQAAVPLPSYTDQFYLQTIRINEYYVELKGRLPVKIRRGNFKKSMSRLLKKEAPELAEKVGSKGYRYKDLESIIQQYNELIRKNRISL